MTEPADVPSQGARPGLRHLAAAAVGLPAFAIDEATIGHSALAGPPDVFSLASHRRARDALAFGLAIADPGFNIFVVGDDRTGRMTATLAYLEAHARGLPRQPDWVYLANFRRPYKPKPYRLPAGAGRRFRDRMAALVAAARTLLQRRFDAPDLADRVERRSNLVQRGLEAAFADLEAFAASHGITVERTPQGIGTKAGPAYEPAAMEAASEAERAARIEAMGEVRKRLRAFRAQVRAGEEGFASALAELRRETAEDALGPLIDALDAEFGSTAGLARWLVELRADIFDNLALFVPPAEGADGPRPQAPEERYAVNLLVDHADDPHPQVVLEPNPTYENLFGKIEYRSVNGMPETDFSLIRAGALHRANGGILVLRAEAIAARAEVWSFLKGALRDGCVRIEEMHRQGAPPMAGAPSPKEIPLKVKLVIVGAPRWYRTFFGTDPDFSVYFKIKADIDADLPADPDNIATYAGLIGEMARRHGRGIGARAVQRLLGQAARWATDRRRLSARFEMVADLVDEAAAMAGAAARPGKSPAPGPSITIEHIQAAIEGRRMRSGRVEDRSHELISDGVVMIDTTGSRAGQVNALTVRDLGDTSFGLPSRVTARVFVGRHGIVNIERSTELGGPLQQKGVLIIGGYLNGRYARTYPLSFSATLTFEQNYGGVEGDSASMAELLAILSALSDVPLRQDVAVTGSVNQLGESQAVGGVHHKIEGFHRVCATRGLSGTQGVLVPRANEANLVLSDAVAADVAAGRFHIWSMAGADDALALLTGQNPAVVAARVEATLERFDAAMRERALLWNQ